MKQKKDALTVISYTISPVFEALIARASFYDSTHVMTGKTGRMPWHNSLTD